MTPHQIELRIRQRKRLNIASQIAVSRLLLSRLVQHLLREIECGDVASGVAPVAAVAAGAASGIQYVPETTRTECSGAA